MDEQTRSRRLVLWHPYCQLDNHQGQPHARPEDGSGIYSHEDAC